MNKSLSDQIREGIRAFERRLQGLEGRVPARVALGGESEVTLGFQQQGSHWKLVLVDKRHHGHRPTSVILTEASVETQIQAVATLPALLDEMIKAHERRVAELEPALAEIGKLGIQDVGLYAD